MIIIIVLKTSHWPIKWSQTFKWLSTNLSIAYHSSTLQNKRRSLFVLPRYMSPHLSVPVVGNSQSSFPLDAQPSFHSSSPMKKKRVVDLDPLRAKRRLRKVEKAIRQLTKRGRKLKPITEIEGDLAVLKTRE
jgi:hypothetical protein